MDPQRLIRIERANYLIGGGLIALTAVLGSREQALGMICGVILSALNFSVVRRLVAQLLWGPAENRQRIASLFIPKMGVLMAAVALVIFFLPISPIAFAAGFSVFLASIAIETVRFVMSPPRRDGAESTESSDSSEDVQ